MKTMLVGERSGRLESSRAEVEHYPRDTHSDQAREVQLWDCPRTAAKILPEIPLDTKEQT